jgi:hypothetical protein
MPGCQVIKANESYCRNYSMNGKTCCYQHRNLENTVAEVLEKEPSEELSEIENYNSDDSDDSDDPLWGPEEVLENGVVIQTMNSVFPWKR